MAEGRISPIVAKIPPAAVVSPPSLQAAAARAAATSTAFVRRRKAVPRSVFIAESSQEHHAVLRNQEVGSQSNELPLGVAEDPVQIERGFGGIHRHRERRRVDADDGAGDAHAVGHVGAAHPHAVEAWQGRRRLVPL